MDGSPRWTTFVNETSCTCSRSGINTGHDRRPEISITEPIQEDAKPITLVLNWLAARGRAQDSNLTLDVAQIRVSAAFQSTVPRGLPAIRLPLGRAKHLFPGYFTLRLIRHPAQDRCQRRVGCDLRHAIWLRFHNAGEKRFHRIDGDLALRFTLLDQAPVR